MTNKEILDIPLVGYLSHLTIGSFFRDCSVALWKECEGFSGKRPICDSGWSWDIAKAMIVAGLDCGTIDTDGEIEPDFTKIDEYLLPALKSLYVK